MQILDYLFFYQLQEIIVIVNLEQFYEDSIRKTNSKCLLIG